MSERNSLDLGSSSVAIGTRPDTRPIWVNGPDTIGTNESALPLNGLLDSLSNRGEAPLTRASAENNPTAFTAIGSNGHLMHGVHFHAHDHHHRERTKPSAGAPSIAGISDVSQSTGHHSPGTAAIKNSVPTMIGFGHAGDVVLVFDGRLQIGSTTVHADGTWVFTTPALLNGRHDFSVGVINSASGAMLTSNHLAVQVFPEAHPAPTAIATISSALDEFIDPAGNHHDNVIQNGGKTVDTSPKLLGTIDTALRAGEVLTVYRDGVKLGHAEVSGLGWSFQDKGVAAGEHTYTARVESAAGVQGTISGNFAIVETAPTFSGDIPVMETKDFLIFDARGVSRTTSDGSPISFDLLEGVKALEKAGMTVKSYTDKDGFISIEVDWLEYVKTHPGYNYEIYSFASHQHVDNDKGGLDYYIKIDTPLLYSTKMLDQWIPTTRPAADGGVEQPITPPAASFITGIFDVYTDAAGNTVESLIPEGGSSTTSTHKITFTFSEPLPHGVWVGDRWEIYRDGIRLLPDTDWLEANYDRATNTGWVIETNAAPGPHVYTMLVPRKYGEQGAWSEGYSIVEVGPTSLAIATITSALDEFIDPAGNHHDNVIRNGDKTADTSPKLIGTLSAMLHEGEVLAVYRDGKKIGTALVSGIGWSYQDTGLATGAHTYTVGVESASGEQGSQSADFVISETAGTSFSTFPMLATEDYLIFDTRLISRTTSNGTPITFDLLESVKALEKAGMIVKSYTDNDGFISIEVDWMAYAKSHPNQWIDFVSHRHVDNDHGGLNYYNTVGFAPFSDLMSRLGTWQTAGFAADGAEFQSPRPAPGATITGVYDSYIDSDGTEHQSLVPVGGTTAASSHRIEGTISEAFQFFSDWLVIYRDGVRLKGDNHSVNFPMAYSNTTWWLIDTDVPPGPHVYTARIERMYGDQGPWSESYDIVEVSPAPLIIDTIATITRALDEFTDPGGNHHQTVIENGSKTADASPKLIGTLSAALHEGEVLSIYRDGVKLGHADVSDTGWSFQDADVAAGRHVYTAHVDSAQGAQGITSPEFSIVESDPATRVLHLPMFAATNYLIVDARLYYQSAESGAARALDLDESFKALAAKGLTVKSHSEEGGLISLEIDWMDYAAKHPNEGIEFISHWHVDNSVGVLDYYDAFATPTFSRLLENLDRWVELYIASDGPGWQSASPPASTAITGIFDESTDAVGSLHQSLIPNGGSTQDVAHKITGTVSEPLRMGSDWLVVYRDGVKVGPAQLSGDPRMTLSGTDWSYQDIDVPPGSHTYTARVERMYGKQGDWAESYSVVEVATEVPHDALAARLMLTDGALIVDVQTLKHTKGDNSAGNVQLSAELTNTDKPTVVLNVMADENGVVSFGADWKALSATHPDATLQIATHTGANDTIEILDKHSLSSLLGQMDRWVTMTSSGESAAFFDASDRKTHIHGGDGLNTISIASDHQLLDLTSLTGKTVGSTIMGIDTIDLGGQHNTLKIAMIDVLNLGETDLFRIDGKQQFMVNGKAGDAVKLSNTRVAGIADGDWEQQAETQIGGVTYKVYEHSTAQVELMVQSGVQLVLQ
jgi:hypothetical protein